MIQMHKKGTIKATPNTFCFTAVINSCAYCENDALEKRDALRIAVETYKELIGSDYGTPNQVTFTTVLTALRNLSPASEKRAAAVSTIFTKCADDGHVADFVLRRLQSVLNTDQLRVLVGEHAVSPDGSVDIDKLPGEWKRNALPNNQGKQRLPAQTT
jgi:hypothetical protein